MAIVFQIGLFQIPVPLKFWEMIKCELFFFFLAIISAKENAIAHGLPVIRSE